MQTIHNDLIERPLRYLSGTFIDPTDKGMYGLE